MGAGLSTTHRRVSVRDGLSQTEQYNVAGDPCAEWDSRRRRPGLRWSMQSVGFPKRTVTAEAVEHEDPREPAVADPDAVTHGLIYRGPGRRAWEERARPEL